MKSPPVICLTSLACLSPLSQAVSTLGGIGGGGGNSSSSISSAAGFYIRLYKKNQKQNPESFWTHFYAKYKYHMNILISNYLPWALPWAAALSVSGWTKFGPFYHSVVACNSEMNMFLYYTKWMIDEIIITNCLIHVIKLWTNWYVILVIKTIKQMTNQLWHFHIVPYFLSK